MISSGGRFSGGKASGSTIVPALQKGSKKFTTVPNQTEDYSLSLSPIIFDENTCFSFSVSLAHQPHELSLIEPPTITGFNEETNTVNIRLKVENTGKGAFEVTVYYVVHGGA